MAQASMAHLHLITKRHVGPQGLIIHIDRAMYTPSKNAARTKLLQYIAFPEMLASEGLIMQTSGQLKLQAVIYHNGDSGRGGHYTAACKCEDQQWRLFNDMEVSRVDLATVLCKHHATMLVYRDW